MQHTIFSSSSDSFIVEHILHAGAVVAVHEDKQKNGFTHYFKITTMRGSAFCNFKNEESARKSRGLLGAMLGTVKPHVFRCKGDSIDLASVVSFGRIVELKSENDEGCRYGLPIKLLAHGEMGSTLWLTFKTQESGQNVRKALWAALMSYYAQDSKDTHVPSDEVVDTDAVVAEEVYAQA